MSIVADREHDDVMIVRSRARVDLQRMSKSYFERARTVVETPDRDYPVRFTSSRSELRGALTRAIDDLRYPNFKAEVTRGHDVEARLRSRVYERVWAELRELEGLDDKEAR